LGAVAAASCLLLIVLPTNAAFAQAEPGTLLGSWTVATVTAMPTGQADEGVATRTRPNGSTAVITRGDASIPPALLAQGWTHIGDPDARAGLLIDAYQGAASATAKLFVIADSAGHIGYYRHPLVPGETYHNSFAAFTPDDRSFVSGEWGTMHRLLVFTTPRLTGSPPTTARTTAKLSLSSTIALDHPVRNVQGCVFDNATTLLCSTNDHGTDLYPVARQLLAIHLNRPVSPGDTRPVTGSPHLLGAIAQDPTCSVPGETEGIDQHGRTLRIAVNSPCRPVTLLTQYIHTPGDH
jgi:hypothetical protein